MFNPNNHIESNHNYVNPSDINWNDNHPYSRVLGEGSFGIVHARPSINGNIIYAAKQQKSEGQHSYATEINAMQSLAIPVQHPNLVRLYGVTRGPNNSEVLLMERMDSSLYDILYPRGPQRPENQRLPYNLCLDIALKIATGLCYIHDRGFLHRDIKSLNILLSGYGTINQVVKLSDFGSSKPLEMVGRTLTGTYHWNAPELIHSKATVAADVFALGIVFAELINRNLPFLNVDHVDRNRILQEDTLRFQEEAPEAFRNLTKKCIKFSPEDRPTTAACYQQLAQIVHLGDSPNQHERRTLTTDEQTRHSNVQIGAIGGGAIAGGGLGYAVGGTVALGGGAVVGGLIGYSIYCGAVYMNPQETLGEEIAKLAVELKALEYIRLMLTVPAEVNNNDKKINFIKNQFENPLLERDLSIATKNILSVIIFSDVVTSDRKVDKLIETVGLLISSVTSNIGLKKNNVENLQITMYSPPNGNGPQRPQRPQPQQQNQNQCLMM